MNNKEENVYGYEQRVAVLKSGFILGVVGIFAFGYVYSAVSDEVRYAASKKESKQLELVRAENRLVVLKKSVVNSKNSLVENQCADVEGFNDSNCNAVRKSIRGAEYEMGNLNEDIARLKGEK